jgi:alanine-synthesizing transaminase
MSDLFARRTTWNRRLNKLTSAVEARKKSGRAILDLTGSNPTRCGLPIDDQLILGAFSDPEILAYTPEARGRLEAREAVATLYRDRGVEVLTDSIFLTASTSEGYSHLFRLLANPGETILVPAPSYPLFEFLAGVNDLRLVSYPLLEDDDFAIDIPALEAAASESGVRAILLVSPGNPTGTYVKENQWKAVVEIGKRNGVPLIVDEVFLDYRLDELRENSRELPGTRAGEMGVLTFVLDGISKMLALPQMKLGWVAVSGPEADQREAVSRLEVIADTYLSVGAPVQAAMPVLLPRREKLQRPVAGRIRANLQVLEKSFQPGSTVSLRVPEGGWSAVLRVPSILSDEEWAINLVEESGVLVHPGYFYDFPGEGHLVVSLLPEEEAFRRGIALVASVIDGKS